MISKQPLVVEVQRGPVVESVHQVMVAVVNETGGLLHAWGNPQYMTMPRSAIKMLQALPLIESGAADKFQLDEKHLALACGSHHAEKDHVASLSQWCEKCHLTEKMFACGPHLPYNEEAANTFIRLKQKPTVLCNNCAGKHAALLATCLHLGEDPQGYEKYEHNAQKRLRKILTETTKYDHSKAPHGVDGCGIPTYAIPLQNVATGMAAFINAKESPARKVACERLTTSVRNHPFYVSGSGEFTTAVIQKTQGRSVIKGGAEGVVAGFIPAKKVAFAIKVADGGKRAAQLATMQLLIQLGGMSIDEAKALPDFSNPPVTNWKGEVVGHLRIAKPQ